MVDLHYKQYGTQGEVIVILHGIFGSLDNWHTVAQILSKQYRVYSLDLRNHGHSPHTDEMSISLMADDVVHFFEKTGLKNISLIGHSMGGKVAMKIAMQSPQYLKNLIVVDIAPKAYKAGHTPYFEAYQQILLDKISNRKELDHAFIKYEKNEGVRLFLMKNIVSNNEGGYKLKINIQGIKNGYEDVIGKLELEKISIPTLFIKGAKSNYILEEDMAAIKQHFNNVQFASIANAGHWVHAENRDDFITAVEEFEKEK